MRLPPQAGTLGAPGTSEDLVLARHHALVFSSNHRWKMDRRMDEWTDGWMEESSGICTYVFCVCAALGSTIFVSLPS